MNLGVVSLAALAIASLPPEGCGQVFTADLQIDDLCRTLEEEQEFPAAPAALSQESRLTQDLRIPIGQVLDDIESTVSSSSLKLKSISLAPTQGIDDLACVEQVSLRVGNGDQSAVLTQYSHAAEAGAVPVLTLEVNDVDVRSFASEGAVTLSADFAGRLPAVPWRAKVTACFTAAVSL